jgi:hypothetical protein
MVARCKIPACAGMTGKEEGDSARLFQISACAAVQRIGMTGKEAGVAVNGAGMTVATVVVAG